jgi:PAS domain S-box-containing protein
MKGDSSTVWVIDARQEVLDGAVRALEGIGVDGVSTFVDARRAILHARREMPDLLVLGLSDNTVAPEELLILSKQFRASADLPVILLYSDETESIVEDLIADVSDAIPVDRLAEELPKRARWTLERAGRAESGTPALDSPEAFSALQTLEFLSRVIEASPNAIVAAHREGEIVLFNPTAVNILGWSEEEALGMHVRRLYPPGGAERIMRMIRADAFGGQGRIASLREVVVSARGELIPVEISAALVHRGEEEIATVGIFTDLRNQVAMEQRLQEAVETLEQSQRQAVVAEVAGAAAHELNQPLTSLLGYAELLRRQVDEGEEMHRVAGRIYDDARRISEIVRKIGRITRYRTREYAGGQQIVDLDEASRVDEGHTTRTSEFERVVRGETD